MCKEVKMHFEESYVSVFIDQYDSSIEAFPFCIRTEIIALMLSFADINIGFTVANTRFHHIQFGKVKH